MSARVNTPGESEPADSGRPSRARTIAGALISVVGVAGVVWWASTQPAPRIPTSASSLSLVGLAIGVYAVATVLRGWRWDLVLRRMNVEHQRADAYALVTVGYMGNTVLPARGGELLRIFLMSERSHAGRREVLGSIITEKLLDVAALLLLFGGLTLAGIDGAPGGALAGGIVVAGTVGALGALFGYDRLRRTGRLEVFAAKVRPITRSSRILLSPAGAGLLLVTLSVWALEGSILWLVMQALDAPANLVEAQAVVVLASLSALVPAGPGYAGTYDAAALFALHRVGVTGGDAVSAVVLFRFVIFAPLTAVGLVTMLARYGGLRSALRREHQAAEEPPATPPGAQVQL